MDKKELKKLALEIRIATLKEFKNLGFGHVGGSLSICDLLAVLYGEVMKYRPDDPAWPDRDKLVSSKGHAGPAIYATLALEGFYPFEETLTLNQGGTNFPSHCDRNKTPGIDMTTGSLGQGASLAVGMALADSLKGRPNRIFAILGDGELNEGQVWEAAMFASAHHLDNLFFFVDNNKKQLDGTVQEILDTGEIREKFDAFGFDTVDCRGNDTDAILAAINAALARPGKPHAVVLDTVKGAGVAEVENTELNHHITVNAARCAKWIADLEEELKALEAAEA